MKLKNIMKAIPEFNNLTIGDIYVDCGYPVLFYCSDDDNNIYLASCFNRSGEKIEFILALTSEINVIDMLEDKITINDVYKKADKNNFLIKLKEGKTYVEKLEYNDSLINVFPTAGEYMEAEKDEFREEINNLNLRIESACTNEREIFTESLTYTLLGKYSDSIIVENDSYIDWQIDDDFINCTISDNEFKNGVQIWNKVINNYTKEIKWDSQVDTNVQNDNKDGIKNYAA